MGGFSSSLCKRLSEGKPALFSATGEFSTPTERLKTSPLRSASPSALRKPWELGPQRLASPASQRKRWRAFGKNTSGTGGFRARSPWPMWTKLRIGPWIKTSFLTASYWIRWTGGYQGDLGVWNWVLKTLFLWWVFVIGWTWWWTSGSSTFEPAKLGLAVMNPITRVIYHL